MSFLNRQGIPRVLLLGRGDDDVEFTKSLAPLLSFRLISRDKPGDSFQMHRLVQLSTRAWLNDQQKTQKYKVRALKAVTDLFPEVPDKDESLCQQLISHVQAVVAFTYDGSENRKVKAKLLHYAALYESAQGGLRTAEAWMEEAVEIRKDELGEGISIQYTA